MKPTQEQAIAWAREVADISTDYRGREEFIFDSYGIERFAALAYEAGRKNENEACAKVAEQIERDIFNAVGDPRVSEFKPKITAAIRARREQ